MNEADFWEKERQLAIEVLDLSSDMLNIAEARRTHSCLGTAVTLEADAIRFVLVGMPDEAARYFEIIRALALEAMKGNERYIYKDPDGRNLFAKYMCMRLAALAEWVNSGSDRAEFLEKMIMYLAAQLEGVSPRILPAKRAGSPIGSYVMHLAQLGRWDQCLTVIDVWRDVLKQGEEPWGQVLGALQLVALSQIQPGDGAGIRDFDALFHALTDRARFKAPYDPRLTGNDVVTLAEIRANALRGGAAAMQVIRSIRDPDALSTYR